MYRKSKAKHSYLSMNKTKSRKSRNLNFSQLCFAKNGVLNYRAGAGVKMERLNNTVCKCGLYGRKKRRSSRYSSSHNVNHSASIM